VAKRWISVTAPHVRGGAIDARSIRQPARDHARHDAKAPGRWLLAGNQEAQGTLNADCRTGRGPNTSPAW